MTLNPMMGLIYGNEARRFLNNAIGPIMETMEAIRIFYRVTGKDWYDVHESCFSRTTILSDTGL